MKPVIRYLMCLLSAVAVTNGEVEKQKCAARKYDENSVVCVCSSKYCDNTGTISVPERGTCLHFESNMAGLRLESQPCKISKRKGVEPHISKITVDPTQRYQTILGFGGAITDSVGINIGSLSPQTQKALLSEYFGPEGIGYTFIRLPMGGSDFSTRYYTYDDVVNDTTLSHFLTYEDHMYKIPFVKQAIELSPIPVNLITSMWQVPTWMKQPRLGGQILALSKVRAEYYQILADYMVRYLDSYKSEGLEFWNLSPQNEPLSAFFFFWVPSALTWTPKEQAQFFTTNLIPTLNSKGYEDLKLILLDDSRPWAIPLLNEFKNHPEIMERAGCLGVHWYLDKLFSSNIYLEVKRQFPNLTIIATEASIIRAPSTSAVRLGYWGNAERYASNILNDLNADVAGWIDWNMALNLNGGPSYLSNYLDAPIIVNASADEFYKQPMFYALAHFSKFVPRESVRIDLKFHDHHHPLPWIDLKQLFKAVQGIAFLTPENTIAVVLINRNKGPVEVQLNVEEIGEAHITLSPHSISTLLFNNDQ